MTYLENARREIRNVSRTTLSPQNKYFQASVSPNAAAMKLLEIAGFRPVHDSNISNAAELPSTSPSKLALIHKNSAILSLILQKIEDCINDKKFSSMLQTPSTSLPSKASVSTTSPAVTHVKSSSGETNTISTSSTSTPTKKATQESHSITCTVTAKDLLKQFCSKELVKLPPVPASTSLRTVLQRLRTTSGRSAGSSTKAVEALLTSGRLQVTYPSPKRILKGVSLLDKYVSIHFMFCLVWFVKVFMIYRLYISVFKFLLQADSRSFGIFRCFFRNHSPLPVDSLRSRNFYYEQKKHGESFERTSTSIEIVSSQGSEIHRQDAHDAFDGSLSTRR